MSDDSSIGDRVDSAVENLRTELNARIDSVQAAVADLSARIDARQGQTTAPTEPEVPQVAPPPEATA